MSLASGSGVGPEAPVMILGGTAASFVAQKMRLPKRIMRLFVLSGICGAHSGFFASPISGIFGLESVHRLGLEYFEAFVPGIVASFVGGTILPLTYQRNYGSIFTFENSMTVVPPVYGFYGIALGMMGGLISFYFYCLHRLYGKIAEKLKLARFASFLPYVAWVAFSLGGMCLPAILFWGEPELRNIISLNSIPLPHYEGGSSGLINLGETYTAGIVFAIGITKLTILPFNIAMGLKGGIVFPLFFIGGTFGQFVHMVTGWDQALCVCAIMAAAQGAITSTPLASALVAVFNSKGTCPQLLIPVTIASFTATFLNYHFQVFPKASE
jgi:H+/Cl- antiporter ClcA